MYEGREKMNIGERSWDGAECYTVLKSLEGAPGLQLGGIWAVDYTHSPQDGAEDCIRMTGEEYRAAAMRTCNIPYENKMDMLTHASLGLASEAGEFAGLLQKVFQGHEYDEEHAKRELGDCLWMIAEACTALGFRLDDVMYANIEKLQARFPDGFDPEKSMHRAAGDL